MRPLHRPLALAVLVVLVGPVRGQTLGGGPPPPGFSRPYPLLDSTQAARYRDAFRARFARPFALPPAVAEAARVDPRIVRGPGSNVAAAIRTVGPPVDLDPRIRRPGR